MTITHTFRSGNSCDIHIPDRIKLGRFNETNVEWDTYPPSAADFAEYTEEVYPARVLPRLEAAMRKSHGPGRAVEIIPGVRAWVPANLEKDNNQ